MTILQSLNGYYARMAKRGEAEAPGFSRSKISFAIVLSEEGEPLEVKDLRVESGKKRVPRLMEVPAEVKRTAGIFPNTLWDKSAYVLGRTAGEGKRTAEEHAAFKAFHQSLIGNNDDQGLSALLRFLAFWTPERFDDAPFSVDMLDTNIIFRLDGDREYIHERPAALALLTSDEAVANSLEFCLVTGVQAPAQRLHPTIKGVQGAQSSGAALVSFNLEAFASYGKVQGANAPTSKAAAFRYGAALNRMLDRDSGNRISRPVGDTTVVFWADTSETVDETAAKTAERTFNEAADPSSSEKEDIDDTQAKKLREALDWVAAGRLVEDLDLGLISGTRFHVLGLAPNAARLSVRFWLDDTFDAFAQRLAQHHRDIEIEPAPRGWKTPPSVSRLLVKTTALQEKFENIPNALAGETMRAILTGGAYPRTLLTAAIIRLRAGDDPGTGWHAAVIKACINRLAPTEKERLPVALDPTSKNKAYQLGRLFYLFEAAQFAALGKVNAPIGSRYYGAASATPLQVFGRLFRSYKVHIADAQKRKKGGWIEPKVTEILAHLSDELPKTLRFDDQARFAVGYYHERGNRPVTADADTERNDTDKDDQE